MVLGQPVIIDGDSDIQGLVGKFVEFIGAVGYRGSHVDPMYIGLLLSLFQQSHHIGIHLLFIYIAGTESLRLAAIFLQISRKQLLSPITLVPTALHIVQVYLLA